MSAEKQLLKQIRSIVYEKQADPDQIEALILKYRLSLKTITPTEKEHIVISACIACGADPEITLSKLRYKDHVLARYMIWKHFREKKPRMSCAKIGFRIGGHDHATVHKGIEKLNELLTFDKEIIAKYNEFLRLVENNNGTI